MLLWAYNSVLWHVGGQKKKKLIIHSSTGLNRIILYGSSKIYNKSNILFSNIYVNLEGRGDNLNSYKLHGSSKRANCFHLH